VRADRLFLNGEAHRATRSTRRWFTELVRERALALPLKLDRAALELLHGWYLAGYLRIV